MQRIPRGIYNAGNSCYVNCILQALSAIPTFTIRLEKKSVLKGIEEDPDEAELVMELLNILTEMNNSPLYSVSPICGDKRTSGRKGRTQNCKTLRCNKAVHATAFLNILFSLPGRNRFIRFQQNDARSLLSKILLSCRNVSKAAVQTGTLDQVSFTIGGKDTVLNHDSEFIDTHRLTQCAKRTGCRYKQIKLPNEPQPLRMMTRNGYRAFRIRAIVNTENRSERQGPIIDLFRGRAEDRRQCTGCKFITIAKRDTWEYSVPVSMRNRPIQSLNSALETLKRPMVLDGDHMPMCTSCKTRHKAVLWREATQMPLVCIIHLKVSPGAKKTRKICPRSWSTTRPFVPFRLNIGERVANDRAIHMMDEYHLESFVCFQDTTLNHGNGPVIQQAHYFSYVKRTSQCGAIQWFRTDDETVNRVSLDHIRRVLLMRGDELTTPYLLFYMSQFLPREGL